jgi:RND family efflux transporter MFP subunit
MTTRNTDLSALRINRSEETNRSSSTKIIIAVTGAILLILLILFLAGVIFNPVTEVKTVTAVMQSTSRSTAILNASGYVVAQRKASVASKGTGRLVFLGVVEGDKVKKNQIVARLEDNDIRAMLEEAKANLNLNKADLKDAENEFNRQKALFETGSSSRQTLDGAEARYNRVLALIDIAQARVNAAEVNLENTLIRAPFDGTVLTKNAEVGEIVAPLGASTTSRAAVLTMADMTSLQVEADVSESNIDKIKINQDCEITLDAYPDKGYPGYIFKIVPTADRSKATVMVKVAFKKYDERVLPEMSAKVDFLTEAPPEGEDNKTVLIIPETAIASRDGKQYVYTVLDGKAVEKEIQTGMKLNKYREVKSGLNEGARIIETYNPEIKNGTNVKISNEE